MLKSRLTVTRHADKFLPDPRRVLLRPFLPQSATRIANILARIMTLSDDEVDQLLATVLREFEGRHIHIERVFGEHFDRVRGSLPTDGELSHARQMLIGSYFTGEYALESAALFNPSIVHHPNQEDTPPGWIRFIMSFRATGEGHISSIEFRTGIINDRDEILMDRHRRYVTAPEIIPNPVYDRSLFELKLAEMGFNNDTTREVLEALTATFELAQLQRVMEAQRSQARVKSYDEQRTCDAITWLSESNYEIQFSEEVALSERIIFPISNNEKNGIEDARFVRFVEADGAVVYYATYTAYNGRVILPQLLETRDFKHFKVVTLNGKAVENKGMALFPRRIGGKYCMISRQDNENLFIMYSRHLHFWNETEKLMKPTYPWEFVQLGNCGSPLETEAGWLLLTHGVGPMRKYCIGAILLDLEDPSRVLGRLREPLIEPDENEREGYVPNVVYTCGALIHRRRLIIPYAMSDSASSIASVSLDDLLTALQRG